MEKPLYLLDGYSLIYRSYFAFIRRPLLSPDGRNTSAVFGFFRSLLSLIAEHRMEYLAVVMDSHVPTFRHEAYAEYKATRDKTPQDLHDQVSIVEEILSVLGIPVLQADGFEADDIIATLAGKCRESGKPCWVISADKDLLQLVDGPVAVLRPDKGGGYREVRRDEVSVEWGVTPEQIVDYLSLTGDQSDNVPGVPGIGAKTAVKLLEQFGTLDALYARLEEVASDSQRKKLEEGRESAFRSRELVTLRFDVPLDRDLEELRLPALNGAAAAPMFLREGIRSIAEELSAAAAAGSDTGAGAAAGSVSGVPGVPAAAGPAAAPAVPAVPQERGTCIAVTDADELDRWIAKVRAAGWFAFDSETDALDVFSSRPVGFSLSVREGEACYIPVCSPDAACIPEETIREKLSAILTDPDLRLIGQNIKFDYQVLKRWGIEIRNVAFDTMIAAWLLATDQNSFSLDVLAEQYLGYRTIRFSEVVSKGESFLSVPLARATEYAAEDADIAFRLYRLFGPMLEERGFTRLFEDLEMPLVPVLAEIELQGILLRPEALEAFDGELAVKLASIEEEIFRLCGKSFNINSTRQLQEVLFVDRKLKTDRKTKTGYSTDITVLEILAREDPVPGKVLEHRMVSKLKSTYVSALPKLVKPETGRLHTSFVQTGTATGRLSSRDPNLQNIPIRDEEGRRIRSAFVAPEGCRFLSADYSQIELVILAHFSRDPALMRAFRDGLDVHRQTGSLLFGVTQQEVTPEQRRIAKTINFGVMYGMSAFRLSRELGIPRGDADRFIGAYFATFRNVSDFIERTIAEAERTGVVRTMMGRERRIYGITSRNRNEKMGAERIAVNTPIQGTAADIVKLAMLRVSRQLSARKLSAKLVLQVHDELILEVPEAELPEVERLVREEMEHAVELSLPLRVNIETGASWGDLH